MIPKPNSNSKNEQEERKCFSSRYSAFEYEEAITILGIYHVFQVNPES